MTWRWAALTTFAATQRPASLTSVNQDIAEQGAAAMRMLRAGLRPDTAARHRLSPPGQAAPCGCLGLAAANRDEPVSDLRGQMSHALMDSMSVPIRLHERLADKLMRLREALAAPGNDQDYQTVPEPDLQALAR